MPTFASLEPSYAKLWAELVPTAAHVPALTAICQKQLAHKATFQAVESVTGVPWWWIAVTDQMEGGGGAHTFLGNGQSLSRVTTEVPAGEGPFPSFEAGAIRALQIDGLVGLKVTWTVEYAAYRWEGFNGWGYLNKPIVSPYLAAQSNKYTKGKYVADHVYDPNAVSAQPGALTILKVLVTLDKSIGFAEPTTAAPSKEPAPVTASTNLATIFTELSKVTNVLETVVGYAPMVAPFFPPLAPIVPFIPVIQVVLATLQKIEASGGDPTQSIQIIMTDFATIRAAFDTAMGHPLVQATTAAAAANKP